MRRSLLLLVLPLVLLACPHGGGGGAADGGGPDGGDPPATRHYAFRALGGVSMGAIGTSLLGSTHPDDFDALGMLGGPFDAAYMLGYIERQHLGGFCPYDDLVAILDAHLGDPDVLNDPATTADCAVHLPATEPFEHPQSFNDWWFDDNGGTFDRSAYLDLFTDLSLALGNPGSFNDASPFEPQGVDGAWTCANPVVVPGTDAGGTQPIYNAEYNPEGRFDVITFCDGEEPIVVCEKTGVAVDFCSGETPDTWCGADGPAVTPSKDTLKQKWPDTYYAEKGRYDPCRPHTRPLRLALAVDLDGDGERDYGEPVLVNGHERFDDVGTDGCASPDEDGLGGCAPGGAGPWDPTSNPDPNGDDYRWDGNPTGTEGDWIREEGEAFGDDGLDGVPATGDFGEGNGTFDLSPNARNYFDHDLRTNLRGWTDAQLDATSIWAEGGIRDIFNFGVNASEVWGGAAARDPAAAWYQGFDALPGVPATGFDFAQVDYEALPRHALLLYGDPDATDQEWRSGDGAHVGTTGQALNRFLAFFGWLSAQWPDGDYTPVSYSFQDLEHVGSFYSDALGSHRMYTVVLPPGYDDPANADRTYPAVYFLHGYGMDPSSMGGVSIILNGYMAEGLLQKMILVYADGRCCFVDDAGNRDCDEPAGKSFGPEWHRECVKGSFYVNRSGYAPGDDTPYGDSILDLMDFVDANFRTKAPADLPVE